MADDKTVNQASIAMDGGGFDRMTDSTSGREVEDSSEAEDNISLRSV